MKLLLLCGGVQPGRDGVGDYTRLLAGEWARLGHRCALVALHDAHVGQPSESVIEAGGQKIPCLRMPAASPWAGRTGPVHDFRSRFDPDWISFQIVPYALHPKGIVTGIIPVLREVTSGRPLHLMFHELWVNATGLGRLRHRLVGAIQRRGLRRMISDLEPRLVTTSNPVFAAMLAGIGTNAALLPLFGNIPIASPATPSELPHELVAAGLPADGSGRNRWWVVIFFGALHPEWKPEPFLGVLRRAARRANKRVILLHAGRTGSAGDATWEKLQRDYRCDFVSIRLGEQPVDALSRLLQLADFGVASSPWQLIGKSGTAAAMLDHGLPVIVTRDDYRPGLPPGPGPAPDPLLHRCDDALEAKLLAGLAKRPARARAGEIAARLCDEFHSLSRNHS